jgi:hypothetical protein
MPGQWAHFYCSGWFCWSNCSSMLQWDMWYGLMWSNSEICDMLKPAIIIPNESWNIQVTTRS